VALSVNDPFQTGRRRGRRARRGALSEINVTPLVDVMLVLLIIFMISAPLLTVGVPLQLPKTEAGAMQDQTEPLTLSIRADGTIFLNQTEVQFGSLTPALRDVAGAGMARPIYVRADGRASYAIVAQVMAAISSSGFTNINLITDTGGPSSGARPVETQLRDGAPSGGAP
jgi:biopolymer transport protein TolR